MNTTLTPQARMDPAFENYFALSNVLRSDQIALLDSESASQRWRRNYIRVSASLIEGYAHCLREMCAVSFECIAPEISQKEAEVHMGVLAGDVFGRQYLKTHGDPAERFGFGAVWLVGPTENNILTLCSSRW